MSQTSKQVLENQIILQNISYLKNKKFTVEEYQRGYKWGKREILQLLTDIEEHDSQKGIYCLQPLILHEKDKVFEIIDGQQRCTSIYLILQYLSGEKYFSLDYRTRKQSEVFLSAELHKIEQCTIPDFRELEEIGNSEALNASWKVFLKSMDPKFNNVDVYHFFIVYQTIRCFFNQRSPEQQELFKIKLLQDVSFIWYLVDDDYNTTDLSERFLNFNKGKISLTNSELIKALFILDIKRSKALEEVKELRITELALEWDGIERSLNSDGFWFFICDRTDIYNRGTRIDLLFDLLRPQTGKRYDELYAYRSFEKAFNERQLLDWSEIKEVYQRLSDWYENKELYHHVGFLIISGIKSLREIYQFSHCTKTEFLNKLKETIITKFEEKTTDSNPLYKYELSNVNFEVDKPIVNRILLLFNIMFYIKNPSRHRFPFELYVSQEWTIEHINPQKPRRFISIGEYHSLAKEYFEDGGQEDPLPDTVLAFLKAHTGKTIAELKKKELQQLNQYFEQISVNFNLHDLGNLTLLDRNTNSAVGNACFGDKRLKILRYDAEGKQQEDGTAKPVYIPVATKNVFSKNYTTDKDALSNTFWTRHDQDCYLEEIKNQLSEYLPKNKLPI